MTIDGLKVAHVGRIDRSWGPDRPTVCAAHLVAVNRAPRKARPGVIGLAGRSALRMEVEIARPAPCRRNERCSAILIFLFAVQMLTALRPRLVERFCVLARYVHSFDLALAFRVLVLFFERRSMHTDAC